jgi:SAM-dependent methyltransferase
MDLMVCPPARKAILTRHLNLAGTGVEFGPILRIVVSKDEYDVYYADYADEETLRRVYAKAPNVDPARIPKIDFVVGDKYLHEVAGHNRFDYIIASHVIEHVPNFIGWIASCMRALKPGGVLSLAVPNANYSFDIRRRRTLLSDIIAAYVEDRKKPTITQIADHFGNVCKVKPVDVWNGITTPANAKPLHKMAQVLETCRKLHETGAYKSCHCWIFDEAQFEKLIQETVAMGLLETVIISIVPTARGQQEFFCFLRKP